MTEEGTAGEGGLYSLVGWLLVAGRLGFLSYVGLAVAWYVALVLRERRRAFVDRGNMPAAGKFEIGLQFLQLAADRVPFCGRAVRSAFAIGSDALAFVRRLRSGTVIVGPVIGEAPRERREALEDALRKSWRTCARIERRNGEQERVLRWTPTEDMALYYYVAGSHLNTTFLAFYAAGVSAMFPPEPFVVYWNAPENAAVVSCAWLNHSRREQIPASSLVARLVRAAAGPRQILPCAPARRAQPGQLPHAPRPHGWTLAMHSRVHPFAFDPSSVEANSAETPQSDAISKERQTAASMDGSSTAAVIGGEQRAQGAAPAAAAMAESSAPAAAGSRVGMRARRRENARLQTLCDNTEPAMGCGFSLVARRADSELVLLQ